MMSTPGTVKQQLTKSHPQSRPLDAGPRSSPLSATIEGCQGIKASAANTWTRVLHG